MAEITVTLPDSVLLTLTEEAAKQNLSAVQLAETVLAQTYQGREPAKASYNFEAFVNFEQMTGLDCGDLGIVIAGSLEEAIQEAEVRARAYLKKKFPDQPYDKIAKHIKCRPYHQ